MRRICSRQLATQWTLLVLIPKQMEHTYWNALFVIHPPCVELPICPFPIEVGPPSRRFKAPLLLVLIPSSDASTNVFQIFQIRVTVMTWLPPHSPPCIISRCPITAITSSTTYNSRVSVVLPSSPTPRPIDCTSDALTDHRR